MELSKEELKLLWKRRILDACNSDLGVQKWISMHGIASHTFHKWKEKLIISGDISPDVRRNERKEKWRPIVLEAYKSNRPRQEWCRKNHVSLNQFKYWEKYFIQAGELATDIVSARRQSMKESWKQRIMEAYNNSSSIKEWCQQNQVSEQNFYDWKVFLEKNDDIPTNLKKHIKHHKKSEGKYQSKRKDIWKPIILEANKSDISRESWC